MAKREGLESCWHDQVIVVRREATARAAIGWYCIHFNAALIQADTTIPTVDATQPAISDLTNLSINRRSRPPGAPGPRCTP